MRRKKGSDSWRWRSESVWRRIMCWSI